MDVIIKSTCAQDLHA